MALTGEGKSSYIPTLDGWRAIAILAVLGYHSPALHLGPLNTEALHNYGSQGVDLFFAISGLLICTRLLVEEQRSGSISLKSFYLRRLFRILPPALVFLLVVAILGLLHIIPNPLPDWLAALFSVRNYYHAQHIAGPPDPGWYTGHFWSLAIEEHFYLFLPGLLVLFPRRRRTILVALILFFTIWQAIFRDGWPPRTDLRIDALLIPAFLAILLRSERVVAWFRRWLYPIVAIILLAAALAAIVKFSVVLDPVKPLIKIVYPLLILSTILRPQGWLGRILELPFLRWIGHISYSIYLWQQLFFLDAREMGANFAAWPLGPIQHLPWNLIAVFLAATLSYYCVEKPLVKVSHRLANRLKSKQEAAKQPVNPA